jgi:hypothetical protein
VVLGLLHLFGGNYFTVLENVVKWEKRRKKTGKGKAKNKIPRPINSASWRVA